MVLRVNPEHQTLLVSHQPIARYMPAMTMPFHVKHLAEIAKVTPGARVQFDLIVTRNASFARNLRASPATAEGLVEDDGEKILLPSPPEKLIVGAPVPDFALTDESGRLIHLSGFHGRIIAINFIYTRCPLPDVCPRLSANFARVQKRFEPRMGKDVVLLSVTIDPDYDTPEVLAKYAKIWKAAPAGWHFLTGDAREIARVAGHFGMIYWPEEGLLSHTSQTGIVARDGRLAAIVEGSSYAVNQLGDLIASQLEAQ
jgi:protein SCO1